MTDRISGLTSVDSLLETIQPHKVLKWASKWNWMEHFVKIGQKRKNHRCVSLAFQWKRHSCTVPNPSWKSNYRCHKKF